MTNRNQNKTTPEKQAIRDEENILRTKTMKKPNPSLVTKA
jgi:hypothetical protein